MVRVQPGAQSLNKMKAKDRLRKEINAYLEAIGAKKDNKKSYEWFVNTKYGIYRINVYDTWIAGRFDEKCEISGYTGKYNFLISHKFRDRLLPNEVQDMLEYFKLAMRRIGADKII